MKYMRIVYPWLLKSILIIILVACTNSNNKKSTETKSANTIVDIKAELIEEFGPYTEKITDENKKFYRAYNKAMKLWKTPFHEVNVPTRFGNAHVTVSGPKNGKKLVLLHGLNATSTMWYPNIVDLSKDHRVYSIDFLLDPSKSQYNNEAESLKATMLWHDDIFKKLNLDTFSIIGVSRGGWLAVKLTLERKYEIEKLILISPAQTFTWMPHSVNMMKNINYSFVPKKKKFREILGTLSTNVDNINQSFIDLHFLAIRNAHVSTFLIEMRPFSDAKLKTLDMPTLVLIGDQDVFNEEKSLKNARELIPNVETHMLKNAGHFLSFDQASEVNNLMLQFLSK